MSKPMTAEEAYFTVVFKGDIRSFKTNPLKMLTAFGEVVSAGVGNAFYEVDALQDMLDRQTLDVSGLVEALEAFAAMRPDSSEASENLGTMRLTWEADTDLFTAPIEMTKRARQALSTFKGGEAKSGGPRND